MKLRRPLWEKKLLNLLSHGWSLTTACERVGVERSTVWRRQKSHAGFRRLYEEALEKAADRTEDRLNDLTMNGGRIIKRLPDGTMEVVERRDDPRYMAMRLRALRPEKYGDKLAVNAQVSIAHIHSVALAELEAMDHKVIAQQARKALGQAPAGSLPVLIPADVTDAEPVPVEAPKDGSGDA